MAQFMTLHVDKFFEIKKLKKIKKIRSWHVACTIQKR